MNKFFTKEVRIALMVIAGIVLLFVGMNFLKGIIVFSNDNSYKVIMDNINLKSCLCRRLQGRCGERHTV